MQCRSVFGVESIAQLPSVSKMIDATRMYQTVTGWRQSVPDI